MIKLQKMDRWLQKFHKQQLLKTKEVKSDIQWMKDTFKKEGLLFSCQSSHDYFRMQIIKSSLSNKQKLEKAYDQSRNKLIEIWPTIDYQQRNHLMNIELFSLKESLMKFESQTGVWIMIPFFNELLNSLYHKEMVVFELPQFYKLYKQYAKECVDPVIYGIEPYRAGFSNATFVCFSKNRFVLYCESVKTFYLCNLKEVVEFPLFEKCEIRPDVLNLLGKCLIDGDGTQFMDVCIEHSLLSIKAAKSYKKLKNPLIFTNITD
jgi:hypothetical protein